MMPLFRAVLAAGFQFLGFISIFMGGIMMFATLKSGEIQLSWGEAPEQSRRILLSETPADFWTYFFLLGLVPVLLGLAAFVAGGKLRLLNDKAPQ